MPERAKIDAPPARRTAGLQTAVVQADPDRKFVLVVASLVVAASTAPYLYEGLSSHGRWFTGAQFSPTDYRWYLMWIAEARDGWIRNQRLYQGVEPLGLLINPIYLVAGRIAALFHLSLPTAYQVVRILLCVAFVAACRSLLTTLLAGRKAQRMALLLVCFSSGLGWLPPISRFGSSVDQCQPEAITFLSLFLYPHFIFAITMLALFFGSFVEVERTGSRKSLAVACLSIAALSIVHPYDLVSAAAVIVVYLVLRLTGVIAGDPSARRRAVQNALAAGAAALPGCLYFVILYRRDSNSGIPPPPTPTLPFLAIVQGYGFILALALVAVVLFVRARAHAPAVQDGALPSRSASALAALGLRDEIGAGMLLAWVIGMWISMYFPVAFQRKLIEGLHIPLAILAAAAVVRIMARGAQTGVADNEAPSPAISLRDVIVVLFLSFSTVLFVTGSVRNNMSNSIQDCRAYLLPGEIQALEWAHDHTPLHCTVQPIPWMIVRPGGGWKTADMTLLLYAPAIAVRQANCGETTDVENVQKIRRLIWAVSGPIGTPRKQYLLNRAPIDYIVFSQKHDPTGNVDRLFPCLLGASALPPYLHLVYSNRDADIYRVDRAVAPPEGEFQ